jgi:outer membrane immunogenic protein
MKKILVAGIAAAAFCGAPAIAADMPVKAPYAAPAVFNWSGWYVGGQVGYGWGSAHWSNMVGFIDATARPDPSGALGGAHLGYNVQNGAWVYGIEGSWSWADIKDTFTNTAGTASRTSKINDIALLTGKIGVASDRSLVYVRGGYANADLHINSLVFATGVASEGSARRSGYVLGIGWDYAFAPNWIFGVEYNYIGLEKKFLDVTFNNGPCAGCGATIDPKISTITARLSYKFDWGKAPVVAKY